MIRFYHTVRHGSLQRHTFRLHTALTVCRRTMTGDLYKLYCSIQFFPVQYSSPAMVLLLMILCKLSLRQGPALQRSHQNSGFCGHLTTCYFKLSFVLVLNTSQCLHFNLGCLLWRFFWCFFSDLRLEHGVPHSLLLGFNNYI